jgi:hypothetical protein
MPTPCRCCSMDAYSREPLEKMLRSGASIRDAAAKFSVSESSVSRHRTSHMQRPLLKDMKVAEDGTTTIDSLSALVSAIEGTSRVMAVSIARNQSGMALKAATTTRMLLRTLTLDLGIDDLETAKWLLSANNLARSVARLVRSDPAIGVALAEFLADIDAEMSTDLINMAAAAAEMKQAATP